MSPDGRLPEIIEVDHPWFIGVQFHPELKSNHLNSSLFRDFIGAKNVSIGLTVPNCLFGLC